MVSELLWKGVVALNSNLQSDALESAKGTIPAGTRGAPLALE